MISSNTKEPLSVSNIPEYVFMGCNEGRCNKNLLKWGTQQQHQRAHEDRYQIKQIGFYRYFAVFDGHGGPNQMDNNHVADYCAKHLHEKLSEGLSLIDTSRTDHVVETIKKVFITFDEELYNNKKKYGTTCTAILVDDKNDIIYQINLGDSRSILFNRSCIVSASTDHKPDDSIEKERIVNAGGSIHEGRVEAILNVSRSFGDFEFGLKLNKDHIDHVNGKISAVPDVKVINISEQNPTYIILTSDAPYELDAFTDETLVDLFWRYNVELNCDINILKIVSVAMINHVLPKTSDDITIILVQI